jgi:hypothetical protein
MTYSLFYHSRQLATNIVSLRLASMMAKAIHAEDYIIEVRDEDGIMRFNTLSNRFFSPKTEYNFYNE